MLQNWQINFKYYRTCCCAHSECKWNARDCWSAGWKGEGLQKKGGEFI